jgi:hypothetical protein
MPLYLVKTGASIQTLYTEITTDVSTTSVTPTYVTLQTQTIVTTGANYLRCLFTSTGDNDTATAQNYFRIMVDGVLQKGSAVRVSAASTPHSCAIQTMTLVTEASHTVLVEWCVTAGTGRIFHSTNPNYHHASLLVEEVAA